MRAVVAPPAIRPSTRDTRETGATMISLRNPNSLSQRTDNPPMTEVNSMAIPTIPGTRNRMYRTSPDIPGTAIRLNPSPRKAMKNRGMARDPTTLDFARRALFISRSQRT